MGVIGDFRARRRMTNDGYGQNLVFSDHDVEEESPKFAIVLGSLILTRISIP